MIRLCRMLVMICVCIAFVNGPEDIRLPLIICSDTVSVSRFQNIPFSVVDLKQMLEKLL